MTDQSSESRYLQTVMRDRAEEDGNASYRYDLLANGSRQKATYIMRAYKAVSSRDGYVLRERTNVAEPLYGDETAVRNMFLRIAYADQPVDPLHLGDVVKDCESEEGVDSSSMREHSEPERYDRYAPYHE